MTITEAQVRLFLARVGDAAPPAPSLEQLRRAADRDAVERPSSFRPVALVAAGVVVVAGIVGVASVASGPEAPMPPAASLPADPPGPLFVLPTDLEANPVSEGSVSMWDPDADPPAGTIQWAALGTSTGDGYERLIGVWSLGPDARVEELLSLGEWDRLNTVGTPTFVRSLGDRGVMIVQQRNDTRWLRLTSSGVDQAELVRLLSEIQISDTGDITLTSSAHTVIASGIETATSRSGTGFTVTAPDGSYWVETGGLSNPLATLGVVGDRVGTITIGDRRGWLVSEDTAGGLTPYAVAWSATQQRIIAVGTNSDRTATAADLIHLAEQLEIVDETAWRNALPNATTETEPSR